MYDEYTCTRTELSVIVSQKGNSQIEIYTCGVSTHVPSLSA